MPTALLSKICLDTANTQDLTIFFRDLFKAISEQQKILSLEKILNRTDDQVTSNILSFILLDYKNYMTTELLEKLVTHPKSDISICEQLLFYPSNIDSKILKIIAKRPDITHKTIHRILRNMPYCNAPITVKAAILKQLNYNKKFTDYNLVDYLACQLSKIQSELKEIINDVVSATTMLAQLSISQSDIKKIPMEINKQILSFAYKSDTLDTAAKLAQEIRQNRKAKLTL